MDSYLGPKNLVVYLRLTIIDEPDITLDLYLKMAQSWQYVKIQINNGTRVDGLT